jgi:hypothetical protein
MGQARAEITLRTEMDTNHRDQLARSLYRELCTVDGIDVHFATGEAPGGAQGADEPAGAVLWVSLAPSGGAGARLLVTVIQGWSERADNRAVRLTMGDRAIGLPLPPAPGREQAIAAFLDGGANCSGQ